MRPGYWWFFVALTVVSTAAVCVWFAEYGLGVVACGALFAGIHYGYQIRNSQL